MKTPNPKENSIPDNSVEIQSLALGIEIGCQGVLNHGQAMATANYLVNVLGYRRSTHKYTLDLPSGQKQAMAGVKND